VVDKRVIVGFDLRKRPVCQGPKSFVANLEASQRQESHCFPASIDVDVWPSFLQDDEKGSLTFGYTNSLNLLGLPDFWTVCSEIRAKSVPVAFDLPIFFLEKLGRADHVTQMELTTLEALTDWSFLGFDLADRYVSYSAIWSPHFGDQILGNVSGLNQFGLLNDYSAAMAAANEAICNSLMQSEHFPFAPCGVWAKLPAP
jgi:hypothetical protein